MNKKFIKKILPSKLTKLIKAILYKLNYLINIYKQWLNFLLNKQYIFNVKNNINLETSSICNLNCIFCGYGKRDLLRHPKKTMSNEKFYSFLREIESMNFEYIGLSPTTGDVFMDKEIFHKFSFLDNNTQFKGYYFYSNFIIPDNFQIKKLLSLKKLKYLGISLYGHDLDSFKKITGSGTNSYERLIQNLKYLDNLVENNKKLLNDKIISLEHRTSKRFDIYSENNELSEIIKNLLKKKGIKYEFQNKFDNWGGLIKKKDLKDIEINLLEQSTKKIGSCSLIYNRMTIGVDGTVNACACRDANFTLGIGNLNNEKLKNIISLKNDKYSKLINRQEKNDFPDVCKSCTFYSSIYKNKGEALAFSETNKPSINLKDYKKIFS